MNKEGRKKAFVGIVTIGTIIIAVLIYSFISDKGVSSTYPGMVLYFGETEIQWSENVLLHIDRNYKTIEEINTIDAKLSTSGSPYKKSMNSWEELVQFLGFEPWNPLEGQKWVTTGSYRGNNQTESGQLKHCMFDCSVPNKGSISHAHVQSGYYCGNVRITMTSYFGNNMLELQKQGIHLCEEIKIITSSELSESTFDCFLVKKKQQGISSIEIVIGKDDQKICVINMETEKDPEELKTVYGKIRELLGIEAEFEEII